MTDPNWEVKSLLRVELLKVADKIQDLSIRFRGLGLEPQHASDLNNLQIRVVELIGKLMTDKPEEP